MLNLFRFKKHTAQHRLACALAPNFKNCSYWNTEVFDAWAKRILTQEEPPPDFLMKLLDIPKSCRRIVNGKIIYKPKQYYSKTEESTLLKDIREHYATEQLRDVS